MTIVHVVGGELATEKMFIDYGWSIFDGNAGPDLVCFTGGADVSPDLYCQANTNSHTNVKRDLVEVGQYLKYLRMGVPMVGICRGGQLLNVLKGGTMVQHIDGHGMVSDRRKMRSVCLYDLKGRQYNAPKGNVPLKERLHEDHHQAMVAHPSGVVIARDSQDGTHEIILYNEVSLNQFGTLCFQAHPEWGHEGTRELFFNLLKEYIL